MDKPEKQTIVALRHSMMTKTKNNIEIQKRLTIRASAKELEMNSGAREGQVVPASNKAT